MRTKAKVNFVIDALMFLIMCAIAGIGLLMKYVLIPGKNRWVEYGRNVDLFWLGLDRHEWGSIHLYLALILLTLLVIHIILHWQMILSLFGSLIPNTGARSLIALIFIVISISLIGFSLLLSPEVQEIQRGRGRRFGQAAVMLEQHQPVHLASNQFEVTKAQS
ncbi:MAG: hypothetical protein BZ151_00320 [Desulfobacca sp. 4484_104]|nr:MAG: hypothetical protein BZ151_00320 [Desulfobacca sp. 4484_104]RLA90539.1 MAG: hypothetical protein DRG58_01770 [Deltaproteobacteria bacterium]